MKIYKVTAFYKYTHFSYHFGSLDMAVTYWIKNLLNAKNIIISEEREQESGVFGLYCYHLDKTSDGKIIVFEDETEKIIKEFSLDYERRSEARREQSHS
jgi:hypothetical protein